jgi:DNA modification methylase
MIGHPATYTKSVLDCFRAHVPLGSYVLDPFAGTGKIHRLREFTDIITIGVELEPEWAQMSEHTIIGNALHLPFADNTFDVIATSPCYGNRMADHHEAKDKCKECGGRGCRDYMPYREDDCVTCRKCKGTGLSMRKTYRHQLGRSLSRDSAAAMQWGPDYRTFHLSAWNESVRVLRTEGLFLLNVSDHIRKGEVVPVTEFHVAVLKALGLACMEAFPVKTPRMRVGANSDKRVECEWVLKFRKV